MALHPVAVQALMGLSCGTREGTPNLDEGGGRNSLLNFAQCPPEALGHALQPTVGPAYTLAHVRALQRYATLRAGAINARLDGDMTLAVRMEGEMERIYSRLPLHVRW